MRATPRLFAPPPSPATFACGLGPYVAPLVGAYELLCLPSCRVLVGWPYGTQCVSPLWLPCLTTCAGTGLKPYGALQSDPMGRAVLQGSVECWLATVWDPAVMKRRLAQPAKIYSVIATRTIGPDCRLYRFPSLRGGQPNCSGRVQTATSSSGVRNARTKEMYAANAQSQSIGAYGTRGEEPRTHPHPPTHPPRIH